MRPFWWGITATVIIVITSLIYYMHPRRIEISPADCEPFMNSLSFIRNDTGEPIGTVVEIEKNGGFYAEFTFDPGEAIPSEYDGYDVQEPQRWPLAFRIYPVTDRNQKMTAGAPFFNQAARVKLRASSHPAVQGAGEKRIYRQPRLGTGSMMVANTALWSLKAGYSGVPKTFVLKPDAHACYWTYFTGKLDESGEYVYEILIYPTAKKLSTVRTRRGPPVVVKRGLLRVIEVPISSNGAKQSRFRSAD